MTTIIKPSTTQFEAKRSIRVDLYLVLSVVILLIIGLMTIYSKSWSMDHLATFRKQLVNTVVGLVPFACFYWIHPKNWERWIRGVYVTNLLLLAMVLAFGKDVNGAARWVELGPLQFQPSELAKILTVLTLASYYASVQDRIDRLSTFLMGLLHVGVPMLMILMQPHLGATLVVLVSWFAVSLVARVPAKFLILTAIVIALIGSLVFFVPAVSAKLLHGYQTKRIHGLRNRGKDVKDLNWQTDRAEIAFGVGGLYGTGFLKGQQKEGGFIPEQQNDFIFSVLGEEGGLVGCTLLLLAYGFFFYRIWLVMMAAEDPYYRMVSAGVFAALFFHTFVNMAMVLQLVPVVGLWLPFMSSGGTAVWLCLACVGLMLNIRRRERPILF